MSDFDVAVIGGGLIGCAAAYYLAKSGVRVIVLERGQLNQGASGRNAGSLHFQLEHRLVADPGLEIRQLEFHLGLAGLAIELWRGIDRELGANTELSMNGGLMVAESPAETELLERKLQIEQSQGLAVEMLSGEAARKRAPYLSKRIKAALYCANDGHCNPRLLTPAFANKAAAFGARFITGAEVCGLHRAEDRWFVNIDPAARTGDRTQIRCGKLLDAAGAWAAEIAAMADLHLPMVPVGLIMSTTETTSPRIPYLIQHVGRKLSLKQTDDGNLLIGGGWSARLRGKTGIGPGVEPSEISLDSVIGNLRAAVDVVPMIRSLRLLRTWAGTTVMTPDQLPVLGEVSEAPDFFVAAGGTGFTYGPTYARLISERMITGSSSYPLEPFSPARFARPRGFTGQK